MTYVRIGAAPGIGTDQFLASDTNANGYEEQRMRLAGQVPATITSGTLTNANNIVASPNIAAYTGVHVAINGTYAAHTLNFEASFDGAGGSWWPISGQQEDTNASSSSSQAMPANATRSWFFYIGGATHFRVRSSAVLGSGTANIYIAPVTGAPDPAVSIGAPAMGQNTNLLASAARTATATIANQTNPGAKGVIVTLDVTAVSGTTPTLTFVINGVLGTNNRNIAMHATPATINAAGQRVVMIYPGVGAAAGGISAVGAFALPQTWNVTYTITGTTPSFTFVLDAVYLYS